MDRLTTAIPVTQPFHFKNMLGYLQHSPARIVETLDDLAWHRPILLDDRPMLMSVLADRAQPQQLSITLAGNDLDPGDIGRAHRLVERVFATTIDVTGLESLASAMDGSSQELLARYRGVRPIVLPDLFETITWAIIGQQINVQFAAKCKRAFIQRFGSRMELEGETWPLFPQPERVIEITEAELTEIQFSRQKSRYVLNVAHEILNGTLDLDDLAAAPHDVALERLEKLLGVGRWTAEYVLMRGIGHPDVIPAGDGGLRRIVGERYGMGRLASEQEVREIALQWTGWRSYLAFYLWFQLQEEMHARRQARLAGAGASTPKR